LSDLLIAQKVLRPTRPHEAGHLFGGLFGLAPDGVCRAPDVTIRAVSSYLTVSPLPEESLRFPFGGLFSVALSSGRPESLLATILPCGVRTFLPS